MNKDFSQLSRLCVLGGMATILLSCPASSQAGPASQPTASGGSRDTSDSNELLLLDDPIVTTATKTSQRVSDSPEAVTVITEDEIRKSGATNIPELLRSVPGVDVMEPNDSQANVSIRGFNQLFANQLLVMVDGRSIYDDFYGAVYWNTNPLLISRIKRIEIVRGPGSVLYGANAFAGVINIITKTPAEMAAATHPGTFIGAVGEQSSLFSEATYSGAARDWAYTLGAGYHSTKGLGGQRPGQVKDSSRVPIFTLDIQKRLPHASLQLSADTSDARTDLSAQTALNDAEAHTGSVSLSYAQDQVENPITIRGFRNFVRLAAPGFYAASRTDTLEMQQQRKISARQGLIYGGSYSNVSVDSTVLGSHNYSEQLFGLYVQDEYHFTPATDLFAGIRYDHHSVYGSEVSPRLSLVHHLGREQTVRLSYGTAYRAPTFLETYLDQTVPLAPGLNESLNGNTNLTPEKVSSIEAGYRVDVRGGYIGLNLYDNHITDVIETAPLQFAPSPPFPPGIPTNLSYENTGSARAAGFELEGSFPVAKEIHGLANYSYENAKYGNGKAVDLSPHNKVNLVLQSEWRSPWSAYTAIHYVGSSRYNNNNVGSPLPNRAYTTMDAGVGYRIGSEGRPLEISIAATNLLDDHHREMPDVPTTLEDAPQSAPQSRTLWAMIGGKF